MHGCISTTDGPTWDGLRLLLVKMEHTVAKQFTYRNTPSQARPHTWLVLVGPECREHWVDGVNRPNEEVVRRQLRLGHSVDILIGRP